MTNIIKSSHPTNKRKNLLRLFFWLTFVFSRLLQNSFLSYPIHKIGNELKTVWLSFSSKIRRASTIPKEISLISHSTFDEYFQGRNRRSNARLYNVSVEFWSKFFRVGALSAYYEYFDIQKKKRMFMFHAWRTNEM